MTYYNVKARTAEVNKQTYKCMLELLHGDSVKTFAIV